MDTIDRQLGAAARRVDLSAPNYLITTYLDYEREQILFIGQATVE